MVLLAYVVPGPDFAIILRHATRHRRRGVAAAIGAQAGPCEHTTLVGSVPVTVELLVLDMLDAVLGCLRWAAVVLIGARLSTRSPWHADRDWWDRVTGLALAGLGGTQLVKSS